MTNASDEEPKHRRSKRPRVFALAIAFSATLGTAGAAPAAPEGPVVAPTTTGLEVVPATAAEVLETVKKSGKRAVVVNLWATWCTPCREEFPDLMRFWRDYEDRGVSLVLVSGDFQSEAASARDFLASQNVGFRTYLKSGGDQDFINAFDPAWSGALPATFIYNDRGERVHSFLGTVTYDSLEQKVAPLAGPKP